MPSSPDQALPPSARLGTDVRDSLWSLGSGGDSGTGRARKGNRPGSSTGPRRPSSTAVTASSEQLRERPLCQRGQLCAQRVALLRDTEAREDESWMGLVTGMGSRDVPGPPSWSLCTAVWKLAVRETTEDIFVVSSSSNS